MTSDILTKYTRSSFESTSGKHVELNVARYLWSSNRPEYDNDPEHQFKLSLSSTTTNVLKLPKVSFPSHISYRLSNDNYSIVLDPLAFNNNLNIKLKSLKINLPDRIRPNCFTINIFVNNDNKTFIVADSITESGLLLSIILEPSHFVETNNQLTSSNYEEWSKISNPYGFDIRKPHILYPISFDTLIVFLKDGGVIGLKKDLINFTFEPIIFNDNSYFESLGSLLKPWSHKVKVAGDPEASEKTVIDAAHFQDLLLTITVNKKLRIWSVPKQSLILEQNLSDFTSLLSNKPYFDSFPRKLLDVQSVEINGTVTSYLTIFLPFGKGLFKLFELQSEPGLDIIPLGSSFEFESHIPEGSTAIWLLGDFKLVQNKSSENDFNLWVLWKSNVSSIVQTLQISETSRSPSWTNVHQPHSSLTKNPRGETSTEFYHRKIFQSGIYSTKIIETVLPIFESYFSQQKSDNNDVDDILQDLSLVDRVTKVLSQTIYSNSSYEATIEKQWSRFDTLCQEFQKQTEEPLKFYIEAESNIIVLLNRNGLSNIRTLTDLETLHFNKHLPTSQIQEISEAQNLLKFLDIISQFRSSIGKDVQESIRTSLLTLITSNANSGSILSSLSSIYESTLNNRFISSNLTSLVEQLMDFSDILKLITDVLKFEHGDPKESQLIKSKLTNSSISNVVQSTKEIVQTNLETLLDIFVLLLVLDFDNTAQLESIVISIVKLFKNYLVLKSTYDVNFNHETNNLEVDTVSKTSNNLFSKLLDFRFPDGFQFTNSNIVTFIHNDILYYVNSNDFIYDISTYLISSGNAEILYHTLLDLLENNPILELLKSVIFFKIGQASKAAKYFIKHETLISRYKLTPDEKSTLKPIEDYTVFFHSNLSKYYLNLATLFLNELYFHEAYIFIERSIKYSTNTEFDNTYREQKYHTLFTIALELSDFQTAHKTLPHITDAKLKEESLNRLIHILYKSKSIKKLLEFEFNRDELKIDLILLKKAQNNSKDLKKSLFYYKALYAFRLKNKRTRESIEALYEFITRYRPIHGDNESFKLISADIFTILLNLLGTFQKDDQWIIGNINEFEDEVFTYESLKDEFNTLIKGFSKDLRNKYEAF